MLIYSVVLAGVALFFWWESRLVLQLHSGLLASLRLSPQEAHSAAKYLKIIASSSCVSALLMLFCFLYTKITGAPLPILPAALSFLIYGIGFMYGMYRCYQLKRQIPEDRHITLPENQPDKQEEL